MKKLLILCAAVLLTGLPADAFAQRRQRDRATRDYYHDRYDRRSDRARVRRGVRSGRITREEARQLRERLRADRAERRAYRSDGVLTPEERREIRRDERRSDRQIRRYRRNADRRGDYYDRRERRRGDGYYRRGAGSPTHPVFGSRNRRGRDRDYDDRHRY
jgi:hypothetical protein